MSFIVFFSFSWFRRKIYESFLLIHISIIRSKGDRARSSS